MGSSKYLASLDEEKRLQLEKRLHSQQSGRCFICNEEINLLLHKGQLDIDHIDPLAESGLDAEENFAITHASCNRRKGASDLRVARRLAEFEKLQILAKEEGRRGANLGDILEQHGGARNELTIERSNGRARFSFGELDANRVQEVAIYRDRLSNMDFFFAVIPTAFIYHDDRINPRGIGPNIRGLIEEFLRKRPQLHVGLAYWSPTSKHTGPVKLFDGQHKAAAQILLGTKELPVRVFVEPDLNVLLQANTNAGGKLRQVAFDVAVMRHLGSTLYLERIRQYQQMRGMNEDDVSFSEQDLVRFFRGERREMERYIIDSLRDSITHNKDNKLLEFVEWAGKSADRPLSYSTIEKTFFRDLLYKKALTIPIDEGMDSGTNPRELERDQMVRLMSLFAEVFFIGKWDPEIGGRRLESRLQKGEKIPEDHLRAWRIAREEVLYSVICWMRLVIENFYAWTGDMINRERLLHRPLPDELWRRIETFLRNMAKLPCWIDPNLSTTVFGPKQGPEFWERVFKTGIAPNGVHILPKGLDLKTMIENHAGRA